MFLVHQAQLSRGRQEGGGGGSGTPASQAFYSHFPPLSEGVPASLFHFYCKILHNIGKFFLFSPSSRHFGNPASCPFSSRLPYPSRPQFSWAPTPLSPSTSQLKVQQCWVFTFDLKWLLSLYSDLLLSSEWMLIKALITHLLTRHLFVKRRIIYR